MSESKLDEILDLLKDHSYEVINEKFLDIDEPKDIIGYTALMYAVAYCDKDAINFLLNKGANPFKQDIYGHSALSIAFRQGMEDVARDFVLDKCDKCDFKKLIQTYNELILILGDLKQGNFAYYIASHIYTEDRKLRDFLGFDLSGAKQCFYHAMGYYEDIGEDASPLLSYRQIH